MESESSDTGKSSGSIPMLTDDNAKQNYRGWRSSIIAILKTYYDGNLITDPIPEAGMAEDEIAGLGTEAQRRVATARRNISLRYTRAQARGAALLLVSVGQNTNATNILSLQRQTAIDDPNHYLQDGENLPVAEMLAELNTFYDPLNEVRAIQAEDDVKKIILARHESLSKFFVKLENGMAYAISQGKIYSIREKRAILYKALKSGEKIMESVITQLQLQFIQQNWEEISQFIKNFDDTELGKQRLLPDKPKAGKMDTIAAVYDKTILCTHCKKKGHDKKNCWTLYPDKKPAKNVKKRADKKKKKKKRKSDSEDEEKGDEPRKKWPKVKQDDEDSLAMISDMDLLFNIETIDNGSDLVWLDSCATRTLFIVFSKSILTDVRKCRRVIGTAHNKGELIVTGEGTIGSEVVEYCPDLRRSILSLGRIHKWGLTAVLPPNGEPVLLNEENEVVLQGKYQLSMPCFILSDLKELIINLNMSNISSLSDVVCFTTRGMAKRSRESADAVAVWRGDTESALPQRALNDEEKIRLLHNRMGTCLLND